MDLGLSLNPQLVISPVLSKVVVKYAIARKYVQVGLTGFDTENWNILFALWQSPLGDVTIKQLEYLNFRWKIQLCKHYKRSNFSVSTFLFDMLKKYNPVFHNKNSANGVIDQIKRGGSRGASYRWSKVSERIRGAKVLLQHQRGVGDGGGGGGIGIYARFDQTCWEWEWVASTRHVTDVSW